MTGVEHGYNGKGEIQVAKKDDMKQHGLASPDIADALALNLRPAGLRELGPAAGAGICITEYDLDAGFDDDYIWGDDDS